MKLLYAGAGLTEKPFNQLLFNCTRNAKCQREYFVPFRQYSDLFFFVRLPGKPTLIETAVLNVCDIDNPGAAVWNKFVVGQDTNDEWYGVFANPTVTPPDDVTLKCVFFKLSFTIAGIVHVYYSQQMCLPVCEDLLYMQGCYPNEEIGVDAYDCNSLYYGLATNEDVLGNANFRYFHWAYLRNGNIIETKNKFNFTAFNNKRIYRTQFTREYLLEFELVPTFYKDVLIGIFNRGNIRIDGNEWKLAETQDVNVVDTDSKLWKMDITLDSECKNVFGCGPADCQLPPCCDPTVISATSEFIPDPPVCIKWLNTHESDTVVGVEYLDCDSEVQTVNVSPGHYICAFDIIDPGVGGTLTNMGDCEVPPCCIVNIISATAETV